MDVAPLMMLLLLLLLLVVILTFFSLLAKYIYTYVEVGFRLIRGMNPQPHVEDVKHV